ncbi:TonB-system energizer ExbB [Campylobacter blaseri]|uniref:TonB-system energizer ExbB n=2 Tax=Campylobacter blaseri TaxID=2042961 RepID=A0A2P8R033_9BACT|nr:TonB-system energizer ExbB [Campylobacter blaseri]PSM53652.1 TonB-system energizer ExbB [Campylobacter blaseri]
MPFLNEYIDIIIFGILGSMSFIVITLGIERMIFFIRFKEEKYDDLHKLKIDVSRNLTCIGIIGSNAPYVGLLGTVVGIIITFYNMGQSGSFETASIMTGLSLALKATALGILVAIPSLVIHDFAIRAANKRIDIFQSNHKDK